MKRRVTDILSHVRFICFGMKNGVYIIEEGSKFSMYIIGNHENV